MRARWVRAGGAGDADAAGHDPGGDAPTARPQNISNMIGNAGGMNASKTSSEVAVDPADPTKLVAVWVDNDPSRAAAHEQLHPGGAGGGVFGQRRPELAARSWPSRPTGSASRSTPCCSTRRPPGRRVPYPYHDRSQPGVRRRRQLLHPRPSTAVPPRPAASSGAVVLQKYDFTGSTPSAVAFTSNEQIPTPYGFGGGSAADRRPEGHLPVGLRTDDLAIDPTMTVDRQPGDPPAGVTTQPDPDSGDVYVSWTSVDDNTAISARGFQPQPDQAGGLLGRRQQFQPDDDRRRQQR